MRHQNTLIPGLLAAAVLFFIPLHSHATDLKVENEGDFIFYMEKIADGTIQPKDSPDPNPSDDKHIYLEITADLTLAKPISIPANVHLKGNKNAAAPVITAYYDVALNKEKIPCMMAFSGEHVILENVIIHAATYRKGGTAPYNVDNAICVRADYGLLDGVIISAPVTQAPYGFAQLGANGIHVLGGNTVVQNSKITLGQEIGMILHGKNSAIHDNTIVTNYYSLILEELGAVISDNTITGKIGMIFPDFTLPPLGQAANAMLLNTITHTNPDWAKDPTSFPGKYAKTLEPGFDNSMPQCGVCTDFQTQKEKKIPYTDEGLCQKKSEVCINPFAGIKLEGTITPMYISNPAQYSGTLKPSQVQIYIAAPIDTGTGTNTGTTDTNTGTGTETIDDHNLTLPRVEPKTLSAMKTEVADGQAASGGGCSLSPLAATHSELNTILALLLAAMLAARACHSSKN